VQLIRVVCVLCARDVRVILFSMYFLKPSKLYFMLTHKLTKLETLRLLGFSVYGMYYLKEGISMMDKIILKPNESVFIDTSGNTAIIAVGGASHPISIFDANDNFVAEVDYGEIYTLPYNSGRYKLHYPVEARWDALIFVARFFAI